MSHSQYESPLNESLCWDIMRVTEAAAIAAARWRGQGDEMAADKAAVKAMHEELSKLAITGNVVIGEGDEDEVAALYVGETIGANNGPALDIAADPLEGTTLCAKSLPNGLTVLAIAEADSILKTPDIYMEKIAIGPGYPEDTVSLDKSPTENLKALAEARDVEVSDLTACILDRSRHGALIAEVRDAGAAVNLIGDGDIAGVIQVTDPEETGIDIYLGVGGAQEGVLAASALKALGGTMQCRFQPLQEGHKQKAYNAGIENLHKIYAIPDMVKGDVIFAATGITSGYMLEGVRFGPGVTETETLVMQASTKSVRWVKSQRGTEEANASA